MPPMKPMFDASANFLCASIGERQAKLRKENILPWLRPDAKSQITFRYEDDKPVGVDTVVFQRNIILILTHANLVEAVIEEIIKPIFPEEWLNQKTHDIIVNPTGRFVIGGPLGDCGLTGRKIIVDTYGGMARHGGGCFSGKDPSKVDRSAAYAAVMWQKILSQQVLLIVVKFKFLMRLVLLNPLQFMLKHLVPAKFSNEEIIKLIREHFDLRPNGIIKMLDLLQPIYRQTATYGHFGREDIKCYLGKNR